MSGDVRLVADHVVLGDAASGDTVLDDAVVVVRDGRIAEVATVAEVSTAHAVAVDAAAGDAADPAGVERVAGWLVPGFVDTHCHGGGGADFASADPEEIRRAAAFHRSHGTTTTFASLVTASAEDMARQLATLVPLVEGGELAGIHLEGPFLSPLHRGAHDPTELAVPTPAAVEQLLAAGSGRVRMVTLAPELPGGLDALERFVAEGVAVAFGHSDADEEMVRRAVDAGATIATHLFNAMRPIHHREPGPVPRLLVDDRVTVELICDGFHLHPDVIALAIDSAGPDRIALVTDAMLAAGVADGRYRLGGLAVTVTDGQARLVEPDGSLGSIAGSTLTMGSAFELVVGIGVGIPQAARMAATTPACRHRLTDVGAIEVGRRADFCVVDDGGRLQRVMRGGAWV